MPTIFLTGASRGLGLEFARQYAADGWKVLAACRAPDKAVELKALEGDVTIFGLDVSDFAAIDALAEELKDHKIDVLLNNAGVFGPRHNDYTDADYDEWLQVMKINCLSPYRMAQAFLPLLAPGGKIVSLSSRLGSITHTDAGLAVYRSSKAALNAAMKALAGDLAEKGHPVIVVHPGHVKTDMGGPNAAITPVESITGLREVIDLTCIEKTGTFVNFDGCGLPW